MARGRGVVRRIVPLVVVLVTLGLLGGGAYVVWTMLTAAESPPDEEVEEAAGRVEGSVDPEAIDEVRTAVADSHERLNQAIGYGGLNEPDYGEVEAQAGAVRERLAAVIAEVDDPELERDLESVRRLLELGVERRDPEALRHAHRILHDLDHFAFNPEGDGEYWGATVTLEGEDNPAQRYLDELETAG